MFCLVLICFCFCVVFLSLRYRYQKNISIESITRRFVEQKEENFERSCFEIADWIDNFVDGKKNVINNFLFFGSFFYTFFESGGRIKKLCPTFLFFGSNFSPASASIRKRYAKKIESRRLGLGLKSNKRMQVGIHIIKMFLDTFYNKINVPITKLANIRINIEVASISGIE